MAVGAPEACCGSRKAEPSSRAAQTPGSSSVKWAGYEPCLMELDGAAGEPPQQGHTVDTHERAQDPGHTADAQLQKHTMKVGRMHRYALPSRTAACPQKHLV